MVLENAKSLNRAKLFQRLAISILQAGKNLHFVNFSDVGIQEIKTEIEALPTQERKRLAAFLLSLRHKEMADYRTRMAHRIDDKNPENRATLEELHQQLEA